MDVVKTKRYYDRLTDADLCDCAYCRNYIKEIKASYKDLALFLREMGVDIEKPFEAMPACPTDKMMLYSGVQYIVLGRADDFKETSVGDVRIFMADAYPMTNIDEAHFVIEIAPIYLKWDEPR